MHRACTRLRQRNPNLFIVESLFANNEQGAWYDPSDLNTLFQDAAGTIPVTASGQTVGRILDKSGRGNHAAQSTAGSRPTFRDVNGLRYLEFDGVDDFLVTANINFTATDKITFFAGVRKVSDATTGIVTELSASNTTNDGAFRITAPQGAAATYGFSLRGTPGVAGDSLMTASSFTAPLSNVLSCVFDIAQATREAEIVPRINGATPTLVGSGLAGSGVGNFGDYPIYLGRRGGASLPFTGHLYGMIARGVSSDAATISSAERYMATKTGVTLA